MTMYFDHTVEEAAAAAAQEKALRDEFAKAAMIALISKRPFAEFRVQDESEEADIVFRAVARGAYGYADAMMKERAK